MVVDAGLSIALASKQQAQDQVKKMSQEMVQSKSKQASQMLATATSLAQCKKGFSEAQSATKKTIAKLSAVATHQKAVAGVSMRGENTPRNFTLRDLVLFVRSGAVQ